MADSQTPEASHSGALRETLKAYRVIKTTSGDSKSIKTESTVVTSTKSTMSESTAKPGFDGEEFISFEKLGPLFETQDEAPVPSNSRGRKRPVEEMLATQTHLNKKQERNAKSRNCPWVSAVEWDRCTNPAQMLHEEVKAFVDYVTPTTEEHEIRSLVIESIRRVVLSQWPRAEVLSFGSFETQLYLPQGDIDLIIKDGSLLEAPRNTLQRLAALFRHYNIGTNIQVIAKARVPIIKFVSIHGSFAVDISINQTNGVTAGRIVNNFIRHMPALRPLVLVVKMFLNQRSMNEVYTGGLGSYSIVIMVASFLKMHPKIRRGEIDPMENLGVLLVEFFELYGHYFNYDATGISLRDGGCYFNKADRGWLVHNQPFLLCIEDPQDRSNDVAKGTHGITRVRQTLAGAYEILVTSLQQRASVLEAKRHGRHVKFTQDPDPSTMSILNSIIGLPQSVINHRRMVAELHGSGALHHMLDVEPNVKVERTDSNSSTRQRTQLKVESPSSDGSIESAWEEANKGSEEVIQFYKAVEGDSSDEGHYGIKSRNKKVKLEQGHEVIYVDSDSDEDGIEVYSWGSWRPASKQSSNPQVQPPSLQKDRQVDSKKSQSSKGRR